MRYNNRQAQVTGLIAFSGFALLGLTYLGQAPGYVVFGLLLTTFGVVAAMRSFRGNCVIVEPDAVLTKSIGRTRRYPFTYLQLVEVRAGQTGAVPWTREYLVFETTDGNRRRFKDFNCRPASSPSAQTDVRRAAQLINERIDGSRSTTPEQSHDAAALDLPVFRRLDLHGGALTVPFLRVQG